MPSLPFPGVGPAVPEVLLAALAMALLIFGAFRGERATREVSWLAIAALILVLIILDNSGGERQVGFYGMFVNDAFALFMKSLVLIGSALAILMESPLQRAAAHRAVRIPGPGPAVDDRDDGDDFGERSDHPLCRPRTAEPGAVCDRQLRP